MIQLDLTDGRPLYEQIKEKIKFLIIRGVLKPDEKVPSVRELAQTLTINPNTIQKAYKDLETEGFIYSVRGRGSFVANLENVTNFKRKDDLLKELNKIVLELKYLDVTKNELVAVIENTYADNHENKSQKGSEGEDLDD
ncbi:GntR family transcriptional regulator [Natranaerobius thermophilus]|uniref:Transcriptional regulator, GntR family n=1 Tax=Natranaerobius thermophilus (strain ATCC BAA-1301 / DSM 18059 / JW/NM-WN-LF) TaxID=457570 RepID=B2A7C8_NATTJ|nr:GntR family transcriptional regulator [Natranaerobius thermophilus]ACB84322.1 transcriptional regulator, GntR family [Natranaerobius thermophilus JW/NM-WN-LF]